MLILLLILVLVVSSWGLARYQPVLFVIAAWIVAVAAFVAGVFLQHQRSGSLAYLREDYASHSLMMSNMALLAQIIAIGSLFGLKGRSRNLKIHLLVVAVALFCPAILWSLRSSYPTDALLRENFRIHRVEFERISQMALEDAVLPDPQSNSGQIVTTPESVSAIFWSLQNLRDEQKFLLRLSEYHRLLRFVSADTVDEKLSINEGQLRIVLPRPDSDAFEQEKGYLHPYGQKPLAHLYPADKAPGSKVEDSGVPCRYMKLEESWYAYSCTFGILGS